MGLWSRIFGQVEYDTTVSDYVARNSAAVAAGADAEQPGSFVMSVDDVFVITGRGTVAVGRIERGSIRVGDDVVARNETATDELRLRVSGIEKLGKKASAAEAGGHAGLLFERVPRGRLQRGWVLVGE